MISPLNLGPATRAFGMLVLLCLATLTVAQESRLTEAQKEALRSLTCGVCADSRQVMQWVSGQTFRPSSSAQLQTGNPPLMAAPTAGIFSTHVCLGKRIILASPAQKVGLIGGGPYQYQFDNNNKIQFAHGDHPAEFDGVCVGELVQLDEFLKAILGDVFRDQLAKAELALSAEKLNKVVQDNLALALESHKAAMSDKIKREVVAELRGSSSSADAMPTAPATALQQCGIALACKGSALPSASCCICYLNDGSKKAGACQAQSNGRWLFKGPEISE
jgi:hypothetical protein